MDRKQQRAREIQSQIRTLLLTQWDPINVGEIREAGDDAYDAYIGQIYRLLAEDASLEQVAGRLHEIEVSAMGLCSSSLRQLQDVAIKLRELDVRM